MVYLQASESFRRASDANSRLASVSYDSGDSAVRTISDAWDDMLVYGNRVFSKLEQGAKTGDSKGWFDGIKNARRTDEVMRYLQHARNADEHTPRASLSINNSQQSITCSADLPPGSDIAEIGMDDFGNLVLHSPGPGISLIEFAPRSVEAQSVRDRGVEYPVPAIPEEIQSLDKLRWLASQFIDSLHEIIVEAAALLGVQPPEKTVERSK